MKNKLSILTTALLLFAGATSARALEVAEYRVADWPHMTNNGDHRARVKVTNSTDAVFVRIPWRRRDAEPQTKGVFAYDGAGKRVKNFYSLAVTQDYGDFIFQPEAGPGEYFIYYLPYKRKGTFEGNKNASETYAPPQDTASEQWLRKNSINRQLTAEQARRLFAGAELEAIESRSQFDSFYPMEVCATNAEVAQMLKKQPSDVPFYTFCEPRERDIRMRRQLPVWWTQQGPNSQFTCEARPYEYFPFQVGVWNPAREVTNLTVRFNDLRNVDGKVIKASALTCFNTAGVDFRGRYFTREITVPANVVQPLWFGIDIPRDAEGTYTGTVELVSARGTVPIALTLKVAGEAVPDRGDSEINSLSRLRWLNSSSGINDDILPGLEALKLDGRTVMLGGRTVTYLENGLPGSIKSNNQEILAAPIQLTATSGNRTQTLSGGTTELKKQQQTLLKFATTGARLGSVDAVIDSTIENDGCLLFEITLNAARRATFDNLELKIPMRKAIARYLMGMRKRGGYRPEKLNWKWGKVNTTNAVWLGDVKAGLQLKLQENAEDVWSIAGEPLIPNAWYNLGHGGCDIFEQDSTVMVNAYCGPTVVTPGEPLKLNFRLLVTPFKTIPRKNWDWRRVQYWEVGDDGNKIVHMHHGYMGMPYINYPFFSEKLRHNVESMRYRLLDPGTVSYKLTDKFNLKSGTLHLSTILNFNVADTNPGIPADNANLAEIRLGGQVGSIILFYSTDDRGIRALLVKKDTGKNEYPGYIVGRRLDAKAGDQLDVSLSWGKRFKLYTNGQLTADIDLKGATSAMSPINPELIVYGNKFTIRKVQLDTREYAGGKVDFQPDAEPAINDDFTGGGNVISSKTAPDKTIARNIPPPSAASAASIGSGFEKGRKEYSLTDKFNMKGGSLHVSARLNFNVADTKPDTPADNANLAEIELGPKVGSIVVYYNSNDKGIRALLVKTDTGKNEYPGYIVNHKFDAGVGDKVEVSVSWGSHFRFYVNGKLVADADLKGATDNLQPVMPKLIIYGGKFTIDKVQLEQQEYTGGKVDFFNGPQTAVSQIFAPDSTAVSPPAAIGTGQQTMAEQQPPVTINQTRSGGIINSPFTLDANGLELQPRKEKIEFNIYYTIRELSNHARELWAFRSLGDEVFSTRGGVVYAQDATDVSGGRDGGFPWLQEHLIDGYAPAWRTTYLGEDFDAAIGTKSNSRLVNHYLAGLSYLLKYLDINGLYLDGIGYDRDTMKRVARTMYSTLGPDYRIETHCSDIYPTMRISVMNMIMEHLPYLRSLWLGENYNWNTPPDFYLVELSGVPFGISNDMLGMRNGGNQYRGMVFGMGGRLLKNRKYLWDFYDAAKLNESTMIGYWDDACPVRTDNDKVYATVYRKDNEAIVAVAHWDIINSEETNATVSIPFIKDAGKLLESGAKLTRMKHYNNAGSDVAANNQTTLYAGATDKGMFFAFDAYGQNPAAREKQRDGAIYEDDSVELFIRPSTDSDHYFHFTGNSAGVFRDEKNAPGDINPLWNGEWDYKAKRTPYGWRGELFVPWATLGIIAPKPGDKIGFNFTRNQAVGLSLWKDTGNSFHNMNEFAVATFGADATRQVELASDSAGNSFKLSINYGALGLDPAKTRIYAPAIEGFQPERIFRVGDKIPIEDGKGWLLILRAKK